MAKTFQLTAQLKLQAPTNLKQVASTIRQQLGSVDLKVNVKLDPNVVNKVRDLNAGLKELRTNLAAIGQSAGAVQGAVRSVNNLTKSVSSSTASVKDQGKAFQQTAKNVSEARTEMEAFGIQSALAIRRFAAFSVGTAGIIGFVTAIKSGVQEAIKFDREMIRLQQVSGASLRTLKGLSSEVGRLAKGFGVSSTELIGVSSTLAQAGLSIKETKIAMDALAKSSLAPSFDNLQDTTEGVIAAMRQFGLQAKDVESALGSINSVAAAFAVESEDIITAIRTTGGVFASASKGVSEGKQALNEFISVFTSVRQTTRESAESIATGLRTIFTRIQRPKTIEFLKEFGVNLQDLEGKFVGPYEAIKRLSEGLSSLDNRSPRFAQITEELGGYRQLGKVIPAIQQFAVTQKAYQIAQAGTNSLTEDAAIAQNALAVQIAKTREGFLDLIRSVSQSASFNTAITGVLKLADGFIALGNAIKPILPYLTALAAIKTISAATQFGSGFIGGIKRGGGAAGAGGGLASLITGNKGFAKGGLVPGVGNEDSVLTSLMPGEFVVRKDAVKAIGAHNMEKINRYGSGGSPGVNKLDRFAQANDLTGSMSSDQYKKYLKANPDAYDDILAKYNAAKGTGVAGTPKVKEKRFGYGKKKPTTGDLIAGGSYGGLFFQLGTKEISNSLVGIPATKLSKSTQALLQENFPGATAVKGQPHQLFIDKAHGDEFDTIARKSFKDSIKALLDSQGGAKGVASRLGLSESTLLQRLEKQTGFEQLAGSLFEGYVSILAGQVNEDRGRTFDFNPASNDFNKLFGAGASSLQHADAKYTSSAKSRASLVEKAVNTYFAKGPGAGITLTPAGGNKDQYNVRDKEIRSVMGSAKPAFIKRASGGYGQAGSPALVMPGEFILNATTAKNLGPAVLNQLNHAEKFSDGSGLTYSGPDWERTKKQVLDNLKNSPGYRPTPEMIERHIRYAYEQNYGLAGTYRKARTPFGIDKFREEQASSNNYFKTKVREYIDAGYDPKEAAKIVSRAGRTAGVYKPNAEIPQARGAQEAYNSTPFRKGRRAINEAAGAKLAASGGSFPNTSSFDPFAGVRASDAVSSLNASNASALGKTMTGGGVGSIPTPAAGGSAVSTAGVATAGSTGGMNLAALSTAATKKPVVSRIGSSIKGRITAPGFGGQAAVAATIGAPLVASAIGNDTPTKSAIGGALSGAAGGAAVGSIAGPLGAAAGGLAGAIVGATSAIKEAKLAENFEKLSKSSSLLEDKFQSFTKGGLGAATEKDVGSAIKENLISQNKYSENNLSNKNQSDVFGGGFFGKIQNSASKLFSSDATRNAAIEKYNNKINDAKYKEVQPIAEAATGVLQARFAKGNFSKQGLDPSVISALAYSGPNGRANVAKLNALPAGSTERAKLGAILSEQEFKRLQQLGITMHTLAKSSSEANQGIELLSQKLENVGALAGRAGADNSNRQIGIEDAFKKGNGDFSTGRIASQQNVFDNNSAYSASETASAIKNLGLSTSATKTFTEGTLSTKALTENLPKELLTQLQSGGLEGVDSNKAINKVLEQNGLKRSALPEDVAKKIDTFISGQTSNSQAQSGGGAEAFFRDDLGPALEKINQEYVSNLGKLNKGLEEANKQYLDNINQYISQQRKYDETKFKNARATGEEFNDFRRQNGANLSFGEQVAPEYAQINKLTGLNNPSVKNITDRREVVEKSVSLAASRIQAAGPGKADATDIQAYEQGQKELLGFNSALEILANSTTELSAIQEKLNEAENKRLQVADNNLNAAGISRRDARKAQKEERYAEDVAKNPNQQYGRKTIQLATAGFNRQIQNALTPEEAKKKTDERDAFLANQNYVQGNLTNSQRRLQTAKGGSSFTVGADGTISGGNADQQRLGKDGKQALKNRAEARDALNRNMPGGTRQAIEANAITNRAQVQAAGNTMGISNEAAASLEKAAASLAKIPPTIEMHGTHDFNINVVGLEGIDAKMREIAQQIVNEGLAKAQPLDAKIENPQK